MTSRDNRTEIVTWALIYRNTVVIIYFQVLKTEKKDKSLAKQTTIFFGEFVLNTIYE